MRDSDKQFAERIRRRRIAAVRRVRECVRFSTPPQPAASKTDDGVLL